ncbi:MAG: transketolase [Verrucomicrobiia bacterium]
MDLALLHQLAANVRADIVRMSHRAGSAHLASSLSCADLLVASYAVMNIDPQRPRHPDRDRLILSKGHAVAALYAVLAHRGFFPVAELADYNKDGGHLPEQPSPGCAPGVEWATGSLGHGLNVGVGMALAARIQGRSYRTFVVVSDGECNEGSTWEAAMFAPAHHLNHLTVLVDYNKWQATGRSEEILAIKPLQDKWTAFGWDAVEVDGHDLESLIREVSLIHPKKPRALIAHTIKGKGVSFMQDDNNWHYRSPTEEEVRLAEKELGVS